MSPEYEKAYALKSRLEGFLESYVWKNDILPVLVEQCRLRRMQAVSNKITSLDTAFEHAYTQGEIAGIQFLTGFVEHWLNDIRADLQGMLEEERMEGGLEDGN